MAPTLLTTKLYIPPYRPNLVSRPRLIQKLDNSLRMLVHSKKNTKRVLRFQKNTWQ